MTNGQALRATLIGFAAIPIWALLPALTIFAAGIPALELVALTFTIGSLAGLPVLAASAQARKNLLRTPPGAVLLGVAGFFCYHFTYFLALKNAPPVEASLVNYLWPVLIVLFTNALPSRVQAGRLDFWHLTGAAIAFAGASLAIAGGAGLSLEGTAFGYGMALTAALIWSSYSVASRLFQGSRSVAVSLYCFGTALLAWCAHLALESFVWPASSSQSIAVIVLGLGPLGIAFYLWDYGCKRGDLRMLGVSAYFAPVLSTLLLMAAGLGQTGTELWLAVLLITSGALMTSIPFLRTSKAPRTRSEANA